MSKAFFSVADWNDESKTRRKSGVLFTFHQRLEAIIQPDIFKAVFIFHKGVWNGIGKLMLLTQYRPFLSETWQCLSNLGNLLAWPEIFAACADFLALTKAG